MITSRSQRPIAQVPAVCALAAAAPAEAAAVMRRTKSKFQFRRE